MKLSIKLCSLFYLFLASINLSLSQNSYYWIGKDASIPGAHDWQIADNWSPPRIQPYNNDILYFDDSHVGFNQYYIDDIPTQVVKKIYFNSGQFFFESVYNSKIAITELLYIGNTGGVDLKGWVNFYPLNIQLNPSANAVIDGSITANNIVLNNEALMYIGASSPGLTRSAKYLKLLAGSKLTLETMNSTATTLEIEDTLMLESDSVKYASLLMKGTPDPEITGNGIHIYKRFLGNGGNVSIKGDQFQLLPAIKSLPPLNPQRGWWPFGRKQTSEPTEPKPPYAYPRKNSTGNIFLEIGGKAEWANCEFAISYKCKGAEWVDMPGTFVFPGGNKPVKLAGEIPKNCCLEGVKIELDCPPYADPEPIPFVPNCDTKMYFFNEKSGSYFASGDTTLSLHEGSRGIFELPDNIVNEYWHYNVGIFRDGYFTTGAYPNYEISGSYSGPNNVWCGWNLMGNPYPSSINWGTDNESVDGWTKTNIYNSFYVWNDNIGQYSYFNGSADGDSLNGGTRFIAPGQGFWVRADSSQTNYVLAMDNRVRVHSNIPFLKNEKAKTTNSLRVKANAGNYSDELIVRFNPAASPSIDLYDTYKFYGIEEAPQIYTLEEGLHKLSINTYPEIPYLLSVPLGFTINQSGQYSFTFTNFNTFSEDIVIMLEDKKTNNEFVISESATYTFNFTKGENPNRFILHFYNNSYGINSNISTESFKVFYNNRNLYIQNINGIKYSVAVFDIYGRELFNESTNEIMSSFNLPLAKGNYIIRVNSADQLFVKKFFIN